MLRTIARSFSRFKIPSKDQHVQNVVCVDFEATCDSPNQLDPMEIIELAFANVDLKTNSTTSLFTSYVKPIVNPQLTSFCQELTGITQADVDRADKLNLVFPKIIKWMQDEKIMDSNDQLISKPNSALLSWGNYDIVTLQKNCQANHIELPLFFNKWIDVRKIYFNHKNVWPTSFHNLLDDNNITPEGRIHCAKDDCMTLVKLVKHLNESKFPFYITSSKTCNTLLS